MENYVGKRIDGRYEIRDVIGVGGMAVVYKAYDNIDDRIVAVKILKDEYLTNEEFRRRFKNESKAIAVLSHRNIVKVFDVSFGDRLQYIVMEYIEGITLKEYIEERGVIEWNEALFLSIQILRALQHAHDKGIVHRDVKPQNIMLLQDGTIKVTDFGIARFSHSETRTMTEKAIGSVHYISPEQAKGELTDEKADIYSVGIVLYEMLTGTLPFDADTAVSVALMQVNKEPVLPRTINSSIPLGFEQITMKAMQKNTRDRYQTASEVLMDLEELKRNPNIKFDYQTYFVDDQPTRFVGGDNNLGSTQVVGAFLKNRNKTVAPAQDAVKKFEDSRENVAPVRRKQRNTKVIGVITGVAIALVIFALFLLIRFISSDSFFLGFGDDVAVPRFIGLNYEEEIKGNPEYEMLNFECVYEHSSEASPGCVISQDPAPDKVVKENTTIRLVIANNGDMVTIPSGYIGQNFNDVRNSISKELGLVVVLEAKETDEEAEGTVLSTEPKAGSEVPKGSTIYVYYAISTGSDNFFDMPNYVGMDLSEVRKLIRSKGLVIGKVEVVDTKEDKDIVVEQSVPANTPVKKNETIDLVVSSGKNILEKSIKLPSGVGVLSVEVFLDDNLELTETVDTSSRDSYTIKVGGEKSDTILTVRLNGELYYEAICDFSKDNVTVSDERLHEVNFYVDVTGMTEAEALTVLKNAGYNSVTVNKVVSSQTPGIVIAQSPEFETAKHLPDTYIIVLTVSESSGSSLENDETNVATN